MATIRVPFQNFAFTDPVAAQQAVQMGQLLTLGQAEQDRNFTNFANEVQRGNTARQNAASQRAMQQGQMNQQSAEAERNRQARAAETSQVLQSQEKIAGMQNTNRAAANTIKTAFDGVAALVESEDPPTDMEFEQLTSSIDPDSKLILRRALEGTRRALSAAASEAQQLSDYWNQLGDSVRVGEDAKFKQVTEAFQKDRRANELLVRDPTKPLRFLPKYKGPRLDAAPAPVDPTITPIEALRNRSSTIGVTPMPSPGFVPQPTDFTVPRPVPAFQAPIPLGY